MHPTSMENMQRCVDWYSLPLGKIVDLGAMNVNGSYRELFPADADYVGVDLEPGPGVDVVLTDVYRLPFEDESVDLILCGQMLEHCAHFWRVFTEIARVLRPEGMAFVIAPSSGPVHRFPVDCYRFYPDSYQALAEWSGLRLIHSWTDERGHWRDITGVFQKNGSVERVDAPKPMCVAANAHQAPHKDQGVELRAGVRDYLELLRDLHQLIQPQLYLEIGVRKGFSLRLAKGESIAIDPDPHPDIAVNDTTRLFRCTSDDFFFFYPEVIDRPIDLAFIDGMHLAEFVYRDFINVERVMDRGGVVVIDDVLPNHPVQTSRTRRSQIWTGDVWRFAEMLSANRPDLRLTLFDCAPTGLLVISKLNPKNLVLWTDYNKAMRNLMDEAGTQVPKTVLERSGAVEPTIDILRTAIGR
ncbi:MAG: methyltransferase domain-containing protein [Sphingomicrobium sp.]